MRDIELELANRIVELTNSMLIIEKQIEKGGSVSKIAECLHVYNEKKNLLNRLRDKLNKVIKVKNNANPKEFGEYVNKLVGLFINTSQFIEFRNNCYILKFIPVSVCDDGTITLKLCSIENGDQVGDFKR